MPHRVLVVDADLKALRTTDAMLTDAGFLVTATTSFTEAKQRLMLAPPDLLMADVRLGAYNGLHLLHRARVGHPEMLAIITDTKHDPVLEQEATRVDAAYLLKPLAGPSLTETVRGMLAGLAADPGTEAERRWPRKSAGLHATFEDVDVTLADLSYGGTRMEILQRTGDVVSRTAGQLSIPSVGSIPVRVVWARSVGVDGPSWCGMEILNDAQADAHTWRRFVDSV